MKHAYSCCRQIYRLCGFLHPFTRTSFQLAQMTGFSAHLQRVENDVPSFNNRLAVLTLNASSSTIRDNFGYWVAGASSIPWGR